MRKKNIRCSPALAALAGLTLGLAGAHAQPAAGPRLSGQVDEVRSDFRPDSSVGYLIGLRQGDKAQTVDLRRLAGLLPKRERLMSVCFKARNRAGTYRASGLLTAPGGEEHELGVQAPGFPKYADDKDLKELRADDIAALYLAAPCEARKTTVYPASFGLGRGQVVTAMFNLIEPRDAPSSRLEYGRNPGKSIAGTCRKLHGNSRAYNVICEYLLGPGFAGQGATLVVDYEPMRGPPDTFDVAIWVAPSR
jgi:hypothetical protein